MPLKAISKAATNCWASLAGLSRSEDIQIHVPFLAHSPQEVLARWYHEGLNAFESNLEGGNELLGQFGRAVQIGRHPDPCSFSRAQPARGFGTLVPRRLECL